MHKSVIKYHDPEPDVWQVNDVVMDAYMSFKERCYQASALALCDLYVDMGLQNDIPFHQFLTKLAYEKKQTGSCKFRLVTDFPYFNSPIERYNAINEKLKNSKFKLDFPAIDNAFVLLMFANPEV